MLMQLHSKMSQFMVLLSFLTLYVSIPTPLRVQFKVIILYKASIQALKLDVAAQVNTGMRAHNNILILVHNLYFICLIFWSDQRSPGSLLVRSSLKQSTAEKKRLRERVRYNSMSPEQMSSLLQKKRDYSKMRSKVVASNFNFDMSPGTCHIILFHFVFHWL